MPIATAADLVQTLRSNQLLDNSQLAELDRLLPQVSDSRLLAREILRVNWLTAYQLNLILQDKASTLVMGPYVIMERLGQGGMGQVFKARHKDRNYLAALKVILKEKLDKPEAIRRFQREIRLMSSLNHPNVVRAYDAYDEGGVQFYAMEYVEGTDLAKLVEKRGRLPVLEACNYIRQAALGLQHAHEKGMIHRDVKPQNLMLTNDGVIKLMDLGLGRISVPEDGGPVSMLTHQGQVMGTPDYIAPEQALDCHSADIRADIYSLGCTFYYLLAGHPPFPGGSMAQKLAWQLHAEPPAIETLRDDLPPTIPPIICKMMAKKLNNRYQTPGEVVRALNPLLGLPENEGLNLAATIPPGSGATVVTTKGKTNSQVLLRRMQWVVAGLAILLVAVLVWWLLNR